MLQRFYDENHGFYFKLSRERTTFIHEKTLCKNKILYFKCSVNSTMYLVRKYPL